MKVRDVFRQVNEMKPNSYTDDTLMTFLNEVEAMAFTEVLDNDPADYEEMSLPDDYEKDLMMVKPFDSICYPHYIMARIDQAIEEIGSYANNMAMFNSQWLEYKKYMQRTDASSNKHMFRNYW